MSIINTSSKNGGGVNTREFISTHVTHRSVSLVFSDWISSQKVLGKTITDKKILVIGGAGSIGSAFISSIMLFHPASLVVVDVNENGLAELTRTLRSSDSYIPPEFITYPMDFASSVFEKMWQSRKGFDIVANFSAHKHVRSEKDIFSIEALLRNNLLNARRLLDLLCEYPPESYFCVSTDKAANPVNIMGASKRIMEDVIFSYSDHFPVKTARFANVAFSNGSLLDGFLRRLEKLQPLSAPSNIRRYFVSPEESGQICLLAAILGKNREIFFPKFDEAQMMTFDEIARALLREYGYTALECTSDAEAIEIAKEMAKRATGSEKREGSGDNGNSGNSKDSNNYPVHFSPADTSGEKTFEEFVTAAEVTDMNRFSSLGVIIDKEIPDKRRIDKLFAQLEAAFGQKQTTKEEIVSILKEYLPNFEHIETGKSLDCKM